MSLHKAGTICIDIGGTYIKSGIMQGGCLNDLQETFTPKEGGKAIVQKVAALAKQYEGASRIGISTAGEVDSKTGVIKYATNIPGYTGLPMKNLLQQITGLQVALENDVNAAAIGELHFGVGKTENLRDFLMVSYGTGIGCAIVHEGAVFKGFTGSAGEIGGLITHAEAALPGKVGSGSYEQYASTAALVRNAIKIAPHLDNGRTIYNEKENEEVYNALRCWMDEITYGLVGAIHLLNPQAVILSGGIMREEEIFVTVCRQVLSFLKPTFADTHMLRSKLGAEATLYGAAWLAEEL